MNISENWKKISATFIALWITSSGGLQAQTTGTYSTPEPGVMYSRDGVDVFDSGYGSGMAAHPADSDAFYLMTDRGPNFDITESGTFYNLGRISGPYGEVSGAASPYQIAPDDTAKFFIVR